MDARAHGIGDRPPTEGRRSQHLPEQLAARGGRLKPEGERGRRSQSQQDGAAAVTSAEEQDDVPDEAMTHGRREGDEPRDESRDAASGR